MISAQYLCLRGEPRNKGNWTALDYVNPNAPKGGGITYAVLDTYDNFHAYALRGNRGEGHKYFYDTLMTESSNEIDVVYPLIAERVEYASDNSFFIFFINPAARNHDGESITAEDVEFSFNILYEKGVPQFRRFYEGVKVEAIDKRRVRFTLPQKKDDAGLPVFDINKNPVYEKSTMIDLTKMPVFVKKFWEGRDFSEPLLTPPLGTGPYRVKEYKMGQYLILEHIKDYWAAELPVNKGRYNFDTIRYDYYLDANVAFEAFKAGEYDFRQESSPKNWAIGYTGKLIDSGVIVREEIPNSLAQVMRGFIFNIQRPVFYDRRIRLALQYFFDFEWMNRQLFYNAYTRTRSYFQNTEYEARGLPDADELAILEPLRGKIPDEVFTREYNPPKSGGTGYIREGAREALALFREAGWELKKGRLVNSEGTRFSFELLIYSGSADTERVALAFQQNLSRYGIDMRIRAVDTSQFINRLRSRDFDMLANGWNAHQTPSSMLMIVWHSKHIDSTYNAAGVIDGAVDYLTQVIADAQEDGKKLLALGRAFDRVLTWNCYAIPQWNMPVFRIAYKSKFAMPDIKPRYGLDIDTWWVKQ
jgi:microcin C transport system substrate-binding protein